VLSQMASEEHLGEVRRLRVDRVAVDTGRVETERRKSGAPGLRAVREKDVVPDIAGKDRHLGVGDIRGIKSRAAADRHDRVRRTGDDRHRDVDPFEAFG